MTNVYVIGRGALSPAGPQLEDNWQALLSGKPRIAYDDVLGACGRVDAKAEAELARLGDEKRWRNTDRAVLLGLLAARGAWTEGRERLGSATLDPRRVSVVMGSSRGATHTIEREHDRFLERGKVSAGASPQSTGGTFASAVSQDLGLGGLSLFVSSACATGLNAVGTGCALILAGQARHVIAGGAEASLTPFTLAQLRAASVVARAPSLLYPCRPLHPLRSGMIVAEGSACVLLSSEPGPEAIARIAGFGAATETATATGISAGGDVLVEAVRRALEQAGIGPGEVDLVVGHGAGTIKGDAAELAAYRSIFEGRLPPVTFHKWLTGHMIGASGAFSLVLATMHMASGLVPALPYGQSDLPLPPPPAAETRLKHVLVVGLGFGGNASALILARV